MNKKIKIGSIAGVFVIASLAWAIMPPAQHQTFGMIIEYGPEELAQRADLIIVGTISDDIVETTFIDGYPARSVTTVQVGQVLKGTDTSKTIQINGFGSGEVIVDGIRTNVQVTENRLDYKQNENVLLFLDYDEGNVLGDGYYVISQVNGKYTIDGETAEHINSERSLDLIELKTIIAGNNSK